VSSLLRSRNIKDYFQADFQLIRPGEPITFAIHLYFPGTDHILVWRPAHEAMTQEFLSTYRGRGVRTIWIHREDEAAFKQYLAPKPKEVPAPKAQPEPRSAVKTPVEPPKTQEAKEILEVLNDPSAPQEKKTEVVAQAAQKVVQGIAKPERPADQKQANDHAKTVVKEVLAGVLDKISDQAEEIWRLADVDPAFEHALNVSTYSVLFALAFGRISTELLADLALAGLLHDIGLSQIPAATVPLVWKSHTPEQHEAYSRHVVGGLELIEALAPQTSARVRTILGQHHEKFDGKGYPKGLQGFALDDIGQLVGMADLLDSIGSGRWDGEKRALGPTLDMLEKLEKARTFPEHFNPEVFATVMRWTRSEGSKEQTAAAMDVVKNQTRGLIDKKGAA
jgi:HD-GYP domain-containing protein (c-di-GMP phosphodiesterase class II)